jgi:hypothetical protein
MKTDTPWHGLTPPLAGSLSARRAHAAHPLDFFYAVNSDNQLMLLLRLSQEITGVQELPRLKGLRLQWVEASHSLQLALVNKQDVELFTLLCRDLISCTSHASSGAEGLDLICARLVKWQRLLSRGGPRLLDAHEIRGLFAELTFLQNELIPRFGHDAVQSWKGPSGFPQDFAADNKVFEIKSHLVGAQQVVRISSPTQLWLDTLSLYLCIYHLTEVSAGGKSLGALIDEIIFTLRPSATATEEFEEKLLSLGYIDLPEYRMQEFATAKFDVFQVGDEFPRIALPAIRPGIQDLTYGIQLAALSPFSATILWSNV